MSRAMRERYASGICSAHYVETGLTQAMTERKAEAERDIAILMEQAKREQKNAERRARRAYKKRCRNKGIKESKQIIFC